LLIEIVAIGMVSHFILACIPYMFGNSIGIDLPYWDWCWIFVIVFLAVFIPISVSGIGVREMTFVGVLGLLGFSSKEALALSLTILGLQIVNGILGRAVYPILRRARPAEG
jgi:uncharacterized membrane protein YbhN (UPF0104 family)